jgi:hypothetical protein
MKKSKTLVLALFSSLIVGCSMHPMKVELSDKGKNIVVKELKPDNSYKLISPLSVSDGSGCRDFGYLGTKEDAIKTLQNKASDMQADYVQITSVTKPHLDGGCYDNKYTIMGIAYKKTDLQDTLHVDKSDEEVFTKKMRELKSLLDDGVLTQKEYDVQKAKLLEQGFKAK